MQKGDLRRRFFVAVFPPQEVVDKIAPLRNDGSEEWSWKSPDDYHVSLAFPGLLDDQELKKLVTVLGKVDFDSFDVKVEGVGVFPKMGEDAHKKSDHVLWARLSKESSEAMRDLHDEIVNKMRSAGFRFGYRDITPHITIARDDSENCDVNLMRDFAKAHRNFDGGTWHCDHISICETIDRDDPDHPEKNGGSGSRFRKVIDIGLAA